uniref:Uncharacterized protein n=1 Tax=Anopheles merus TaxID=30066 RepID=A0A182V080_ANOME
MTEVMLAADRTVKRFFIADSPLPRRDPTHMARRSRLEMMEQRPHRCITPSTEPWRELDDRRLAVEGSMVGPPDEDEVATVVAVVLLVAAVCPPPTLSVDAAGGARRPSDAEHRFSTV